MKQFKYFFISMRPYQWSKNLLVFAALIFSGHLFLLEDFLMATLTFFIFCFTAGSIYIINDLRDRKIDKIHPYKKTRPIATGKLNFKTAIFFAFVFISIGLFLSFILVFQLFIILLCYIGLNLLYSFRLKYVAVVDVLIISFGYVLRAVAGAIVIQVEISSWLLICSFFLALFLIMGKRRSELLLQNDKCINFRTTLNDYNKKILDQFIAIASGMAILSYAIYTVDILHELDTQHLIYTIPIVIYGIFRYLYLIYAKDKGEEPAKMLFLDKHIFASVLLWGFIVTVIIYFRSDIFI